MPESDLNLTPTDDLIMELARRNKAIVVLQLRDDKLNPKISRMLVWHEGGMFNALGMARQFIHDALSRSEDELYPDE